MNTEEKRVLRAVLDMLMYLPDIPHKWKTDTFGLAVEAGLFPELDDKENEA